VERANVVVLQIDLDEGLPVVVALVQLHLVQHKARKIQLSARPHTGQIGLDVAAVVFKQQTVPFFERVVVQVQARVVREVRRAQQGTGWLRTAGAVGPAVQGAHNVACRRARMRHVHRAAPLQHHGLAMAADIGDQLYPLRRVHQGAPVTLVRQGRVITWLGHAQPMADITRAGLEQGLQFALVQRVVKVA
jgi:hypothetical protein